MGLSMAENLTKSGSELTKLVCRTGKSKMARKKTAEPGRSVAEGHELIDPHPLAQALAQALKAIGEPHLGAAALLSFELHQRPEHVRNGDITWADYRPAHRPDAVHIRHPKTGAKGWVAAQQDPGIPVEVQAGGNVRRPE
jgi:hypothetical protein